MPEPSATPGDDPWYVETLHEGLRTSIQVRRVLFDSRTEHQRLVIAESVAFGTFVMLDGVTQLRRVPAATVPERFAASGPATRYYTPEVHLASFALPRFILDIVEAGRGDVDASRPERAR